jgi:hypothetical protein
LKAVAVSEAIKYVSFNTKKKTCFQNACPLRARNSSKKNGQTAAVNIKQDIIISH